MTDYMFTLILNDFHQSDYHKNRLKRWVFGNPQQLLVTKTEKAKTNIAIVGYARFDRIMGYRIPTA
jgi:hypothetical protein